MASSEPWAVQAEGYFFVPFISCPPWWRMMCVTSPLSFLKNSASASTTFRKNFVS